MHLNYIKGVRHVWQLGPFVIYLMYVRDWSSNVCLLVPWAQVRHALHTLNTQMMFVLFTIHSILLGEDISKASMIVMVLLDTLCNEEKR